MPFFARDAAVLAGHRGVGARIGQHDIRVRKPRVEGFHPASGCPLRIAHARAQVLKVAEEGVGNPAGGLDPQHKHRIRMGQVVYDLAEDVRLRELIHLRDGVHFQRKGVLKAVGQGALLLPGVQTFVHTPGLIRIAQALFDILQVAVAQLAQKASHGDPLVPLA